MRPRARRSVDARSTAPTSCLEEPAMKIKPLTLEQQAASDRVHLLGGLQARLLNEEGHDSPAYQQVERDLDAAIDERSRSMGWATFAPSPPPPAPALATMPPSSSLGQGGTSASA